MPEVKAFETETAQCRAREVDMVINTGAAKSGEWELVQRGHRSGGTGKQGTRVGKSQKTNIKKELEGDLK